MAPLLEPGDFLVVRVSRGAPQPGRIVLVDHPRLGLIVKQLGAIEDPSAATPSYSLHGINPDSISSATMGVVSIEAILGQARWKVGRKGLSSILNLEVIEPKPEVRG